MTTHVLNSVQAGITRLRIKGGASKESLYDLQDGYVTVQRTMKIRPGSPIIAQLPAGSVAITAFQGKIVFFNHQQVAAPSSLFVCAVIKNPFSPTMALKRIHFAGLFAGALYVVAEFVDGSYGHYWLEDFKTWVASTIYTANGIVMPSVANGLAYKATRLGSAYPAWAPRVVRAIGDKVEPTVYNGYYFEVTAISGTNPASGDTEPEWPSVEGTQVFETVDGSAGTPSDGSTTGVPPTPGTAPGSGEGGEDPYCVEEHSWLSEYLQAKDYYAGLSAELHTPERGYYSGPCARAGLQQLVRCVRIVTPTTSLICSRTTPVNHFDATQDLAEDGRWSMAPDLLGKIVRVEHDSEEVIAVEDIGWRWVKPLNFSDASFAAAEYKGGRRIFTHNARIVK